MTSLPIPKASIEMCVKFEGCRLKLYLCPAGKPTIGYGHRCDINQKELTPQEALDLLHQDLQIAQDEMVKLIPSMATEPDNRRAAIIDFVFNLGIGRLKGSTLAKRLAAKDWPQAADELMKWVHDGTTVLPGLVKRRQAEAVLLLSLPESVCMKESGFVHTADTTPQTQSNK